MKRLGQRVTYAAMKLVSPNAQETATVEAQDFKTLKLSAPALSLEALDRYLAFQKSYVESLEGQSSRDSHLLAEAHRKAQAESGASIDEIGRIGSLCTDFAGKRVVELKLREHHGKVKASIEGARQSGKAADERDLELHQKLEEEFAQGSAYERVAKRWGAEAVQVLRQREEQILELHRRQLKAHL